MLEGQPPGGVVGGDAHRLADRAGGPLVADLSHRAGQVDQRRAVHGQPVHQVDLAGHVRDLRPDLVERHPVRRVHRAHPGRVVPPGQLHRLPRPRRGVEHAFVRL